MHKVIGIGSVLLIAAAAAILLVFRFTASEPSDAPVLSGAMSKFTMSPAGTDAPDVAFATASGGEMRLSDFRGKTVLLNLWATWCAPCVKELPDLDALQASMGGETFEVVALSSDREGAAKVEPFLDQLGIRRLTAYLDPASEATRAFSPRGLPTSILIDADGREIGRLEGAASWDAPEARDLIRFYIDRSG